MKQLCDSIETLAMALHERGVLGERFAVHERRQAQRRHAEVRGKLIVDE